MVTNDLSLVDRGANGGLAGADVRLLESMNRCADITGLEGIYVSEHVQV